MVNYTGLENLCIIEDNPNVAKRIITDLMNMEFTQHDIDKRQRVLEAGFGNRHNAELIAKEIFGNVEIMPASPASQPAQ